MATGHLIPLNAGRTPAVRAAGTSSTFPNQDFLRSWCASYLSLFLFSAWRLPGSQPVLAEASGHHSQRHRQPPRAEAEKPSRPKKL